MASAVGVTGGASGIGARIVETFEERGFDVVILDRNDPGNGKSFVPCDLSEISSIDAAVAALPKNLSAFVNAAGVSGLAPISTIMKVNFYGLRYLTESVAGRLSEGGSVVNIASTASWFWRDHLSDVGQILEARTEEQVADVCANLIHDGHTAYARSKEAVLVWSAVAAQEFLGRFRVNSVSPGATETPLLAEFYEAMGHEELDPLTKRAGGRNGYPQEIANVVSFLCSPEANWINGTDIPVDNSAEVSEFLASQNIIRPLEK